MAEDFDPYQDWLGIPPAEQPPDHYRLLGLSRFEGNPATIKNAVLTRARHLRKFQLGRFAKHSERILNEISAARVCLLDSGKKAAYDASLAADSEENIASLITNLDAKAPRRLSPREPLQAMPPVVVVASPLPVVDSPSLVVVDAPPLVEVKSYWRRLRLTKGQVLAAGGIGTIIVLAALLLNEKARSPTVVVQEVTKEVPVVKEVLKEIVKNVPYSVTTEVPAKLTDAQTKAIELAERFRSAKSAIGPSVFVGVRSVRVRVFFSDVLRGVMAEESVTSTFRAMLQRRGIQFDGDFSSPAIDITLDGFWNNEKTQLIYTVAAELSETTGFPRGESYVSIPATTWRGVNYGFAGSSVVVDAIQQAVAKECALLEAAITQAQQEAAGTPLIQPRPTSPSPATTTVPPLAILGGRMPEERDVRFTDEGRSLLKSAQEVGVLVYIEGNQVFKGQEKSLTDYAKNFIKSHKLTVDEGTPVKSALLFIHIKFFPDVGYQNGFPKVAMCRLDATFTQTRDPPGGARQFAKTWQETKNASVATANAYQDLKEQLDRSLKKLIAAKGT